VSEHQDNAGVAVTNSSSAVIYLESAPDGGSLGKLVFREKKTYCPESQLEMEVDAIAKRLISWDNDACLHSFHTRHDGARHLLGPMTLTSGGIVGVGGAATVTVTTTSTTTTATMTDTSTTTQSVTMTSTTTGTMTYTSTETTSTMTTVTVTTSTATSITMTDTSTTTVVTSTVTAPSTMTATATQAIDGSGVSAAEGFRHSWWVPIALSCLLRFHS